MSRYSHITIKELLIIKKLELSKKDYDRLRRVAKVDLYALKVAILEKKVFESPREVTNFIYNFLVGRGYSWDVAFEVTRILRRFFEKGMFIDAYYPNADMLWLLDVLSTGSIRTIPLGEKVSEGVRA